MQVSIAIILSVWCLQPSPSSSIRRLHAAGRAREAAWGGGCHRRGPPATPSPPCRPVTPLHARRRHVADDGTATAHADGGAGAGRLRSRLLDSGHAAHGGAGGAGDALWRAGAARWRDWVRTTHYVLFLFSVTFTTILRAISFAFAYIMYHVPYMHTE